MNGKYDLVRQECQTCASRHDGAAPHQDRASHPAQHGPPVGAASHLDLVASQEQKRRTGEAAQSFFSCFNHTNNDMEYRFGKKASSKRVAPYSTPRYGTFFGSRPPRLLTTHHSEPEELASQEFRYITEYKEFQDRLINIVQSNPSLISRLLHTWLSGTVLYNRLFQKWRVKSGVPDSSSDSLPMEEGFAFLKDVLQWAINRPLDLDMYSKLADLANTMLKKCGTQLRCLIIQGVTNGAISQLWNAAGPILKDQISSYRTGNTSQFNKLQAFVDTIIVSQEDWQKAIYKDSSVIAKLGGEGRVNSIQESIKIIEEFQNVSPTRRRSASNAP